MTSMPSTAQQVNHLDVLKQRFNDMRTDLLSLSMTQGILVQSNNRLRETSHSLSAVLSAKYGIQQLQLPYLVYGGEPSIRRIQTACSDMQRRLRLILAEIAIVSDECKRQSDELQILEQHELAYNASTSQQLLIPFNIPGFRQG